jgi:hypothetical protein
MRREDSRTSSVLLPSSSCTLIIWVHEPREHTLGRTSGHGRIVQDLVELESEPNPRRRQRYRQPQRSSKKLL